LLEAKTADARREKLSDLRRALSAMTAAEAVTAIRKFLDTKADAPTGQGFKVGGNGNLAQAPTLRTWLLDYLGQIDPGAAAAYARTILANSDSADEWAVSLRNIARGDTTPDGRALLAEKTGELLRNEAWQQNPSVGYLESFDTAVFLGGTSLVPTLQTLVSKQDNPAVAHAAYLTLDRLVINDTAKILTALASDGDAMRGRELTRADYFARADVRDSSQRQVLEAYLLDSKRSDSELNQFAGVFPNANYMISQNLLTSTPTPDHAGLISRDTESLRVVQEWLSDARFSKLRPQLEKIQSRLQGFARQASNQK
jgi:hypothetical protein